MKKKTMQTLADVDNERWHFCQTVCKSCIEYFCSLCNFEVPVRSCSSQL